MAVRVLIGVAAVLAAALVIASLLFVAAVEERGVGFDADAAVDDGRAQWLVAGLAGRLADRLRLGCLRLAGRRGRTGRAVRVPVPVPGRRGEHRARMDDVEPERRLRDRLHRGVSGGADGAGVLVLPVVPVRPGRVDG